MKKKGLERNLVVFLFMMVLVVFSFAQRDSKKFEHYYSTARLLKISAAGITYSASNIPLVPPTNN